MKKYNKRIGSVNLISGIISMNNKIEIKYCTKCRWLMRSAWMIQELLSTFENELHDASLQPGEGGIFEIFANGELIWSRKTMGRFPEITELKQLVRDIIAPAKDLGCIDRKTTKQP
jgi:selenoprotein W-related protein